MTDAAKISPANTLLALKLRQRLLTRFGVPVTDVVRFWPIPFLLSFAIAIGFISTHSGSDAPRYIASAYHGLLGLTAFIIGLACGNDDLDRGTLWFLRALPLPPLRLLLQKLAACLVMIALFIAMAEIVAYAGVFFLIEWQGWLFPTLEDFDFPTLWNFGAWLPLSLVQVLCLIMVGLASGVIFKNFVYSALAGLAAYVVWYVGWYQLLKPLEANNRIGEFHLAMTMQQLLLCAGAGMLFVRAVTHMNFLAVRGSAMSDVEAESKRRRHLRIRLPWETHPSPYGGRLFLTALLTAVGAAIAAAILPNIGDQTNGRGEFTELGWLIVPLPAAIIGVSLFARDELLAHTSLLYWQPVSRARLLSERIPKLVIYSITAALPALMLAEHLKPMHYLPLLCLSIGTGLLGALARLFYRNPVFPLILTAIVSYAAQIVLFSSVGEIGWWRSDGDMTERLVQQAWFSIIVIVVPLLALKVAYSKTALLTVRESARTFLGISVLYSFAAVIYLLITAQLDELVWLLVYWITSPFGMSMGGAA